MPISFPADSVGLVTPQTAQFESQLQFESGKKLDRYQIVYETYGTLNAQKSNAVLICHALSGDHHAAGFHREDETKPGWWDNMIGPGKPFDTNKFFIVSLNNLGGCKGSTGPTSINPANGKPYGPDFPIATVKDWVKSQHQLMQRLDLPHWAAVIGGSLGGMQALQWSIDFPDLVKHAIIIAASPRLSAQNIAFNEVAREAIISDPEFHHGHYYEHGVVPRRGLILARMLGHITYLSNEAMADKFGRELRDGKLNYDYQKEFQIQSYLHHQGQSFVDRFDANTYLLMTKALDYFDPAKDYDNSLSKALSHTSCDYLIVSFSSDWRFSPAHSRELVRALLDVDKDVSYAEIVAQQGHDSFLLPDPQYTKVLTSYLNNIAKKCS